LFTFFLLIFRLRSVTAPYLEDSLFGQRPSSELVLRDAVLMRFGPVRDAQALTSNFWNTAKFFGIEVALVEALDQDESVIWKPPSKLQ
jgi:hypothetical protein